MTSEQFDRLVTRLQVKYGSRPLALRMRIALLVVLGYAGFLAILLLVLVLCTGLVIAAFLSGKEPSILLMAVVAVLLAFGICQALVFLWVPLEADKARDVTRDEAPRLFQLLDNLQEGFGISPFARVRVTSDFNAGVQMIPRLGVFGFNRNYLYLGLPLMQVLTEKQLTAVLAHECAHCSSRHDRFGMWIYRLRRTWTRVFAALQGADSTSSLKQLRGMILWFVDWYWPRFNAHAFVLSRADEYEADRASAEWAGPETVAESLFRIGCTGIRLGEKFWFETTLQARQVPDPPDDIVVKMESYLSAPPEADDAARWLEQAAQTLTGNIDTHPSLSDRLKALNQGVDRFLRRGFPMPPKESSAKSLLEGALPRVTSDVSLQWQKENTLRWQNTYHQARRLERQLESTKSAEPDSQQSLNGAQLPDFDIDKAWQQVCIVCELQGTAAAEPLLRQLLDHRPSHAPANVTLGRHLLELGRPEGEQFLLRVLEEDDNDLIPAACEGLINYFQQLGQPDRVGEARLQLSRFESAQAAASKERHVVTASDKFIPHGLSEDELDALTEQLSQQRDYLDSAWLARKELKYFQRQKLFVMVVQSQPTGLFGTTDPENDRRIVSKLIGQVNLPGRVLVIAPQGNFRRLARRIRGLPGSQVYSADQPAKSRSS